MEKILSVVVPVYGTEKYLRACLDSLLNQTLKEIQVILVDDCSPDNSRQIMEEYISQDNRFQLVTYKKNKGLFGARVAGAKVAKGKYIAFLDSDDYISIDFYRRAVETAEKGNFDVVMGDTVIEYEDGRKTVYPTHRECTVKDEYYGNDVREAFYSQEMNCYAWHTVWNKIYKKEVWDRCEPYFNTLTKHIIMTEDVAFSSLLLYEAQSFAHIKTTSVFYCMHSTSSTGASLASVKKTLKNYDDIVSVFEFVDSFLAAKKDVVCRAYFEKARERFCRMWHSAAINICKNDSAALKTVKELSKRLSPGCDGTDDPAMWWYERNPIIWDPTFEELKKKIADDSVKMVSFDIFDTLVLRPFSEPTDVFELMQPEFDALIGATHISFADIRSQAEKVARRRAYGREDILIDEIYKAMADEFSLDESICNILMEKEKEYEIKYIRPRYAGIELLEFAIACKKPVVLISDMYLDRATVERMLEKAHVTGWKALYLSSEVGVLKYSGKLFKKALQEQKVTSEEVLHIGDNFGVDHDAAVKVGMQAAIQPKPVYMFKELSRSRLSELGKQAFAAFSERDAIEKTLSGRCMQALISNYFFDNAFQPQHPQTFFSESYAQMGYAAIGPHLVAIADWLIEVIRRNGYTYMAFLARDGYLVKKALEVMLPNDLRGKIKLDYLVASRKTLLPALTMQSVDFYALPINRVAYTPNKLWNLLSYCTMGEKKDYFRDLDRIGISWNTTFTNDTNYNRAIALFLKKYYDAQKHEKALEALRAYYAPLQNEKSACFDMGYSGHLQAAISAVCNRPVPVCFIHRDSKDQCNRVSNSYRYTVHSFYDVKPGMSGAFREFLLSSSEPGAQHIEMKDEKPQVIYGKTEYNRVARFVVEVLQHHALRFVEDWENTFGDAPQLRVERTIMSLPFESMLRYMKPLDVAMFNNCIFEDVVFAGDDHLDLAQLICEQMNQANESLNIMKSPTEKETVFVPQTVYVPQLPEGMVAFNPAQVSKAKRVMGYMLFDQNRLKTAVQNRLEGHPKVYKVVSKVYNARKK